MGEKVSKSKEGKPLRRRIENLKGSSARVLRRVARRLESNKLLNNLALFTLKLYNLQVKLLV